MLYKSRLSLLIVLLTLGGERTYGQLSSNWLEIAAHDEGGHPKAHVELQVTGPLRSVVELQSDRAGHVMVALPYGQYFISQKGARSRPAMSVLISAAAKTSVDVVVDNSGAVRRLTSTIREEAGLWLEQPVRTTYPEGFTLASQLNSRMPSTIAVPLNFSGFADNRLALISVGARSWTDTQFQVQGLDMTDSYQPGRPEFEPDAEALSEAAVRTGGALLTSTSYGSEVSTYFVEPSALWHGAISTTNTGSGLSSGNLPPAAERGALQQSEGFRWFTRNRVEATGPLGSRADAFAAISGQWADQTIGIAPPGQDQVSRALFVTTRGRVSASARDQIDLSFIHWGDDLSNWGVPAGIEAFVSRRGSPEYDRPDVFPDEAERDSFDALQIGWTHHTGSDSRLGALELRYGYSRGHYDTWPRTIATPFQSRIELLGGEISGAPPLSTLATRSRHEIAAGWQPHTLVLGAMRHQIVTGGNWASAVPQNRFHTPSNLNLVTVNGAPAYVVEYNTPAATRVTKRVFTPYVADQVAVREGLAVSVGVLGDFSRGSLPARSDVISWNSVSPRAGFTWQVPRMRGLVLNGSYLRTYTPLAGRYLDYGDTDSLGGSVYAWHDLNNDGWFTPNEQGPLLMRFGGPYSSISPGLKRPYADEFDVGAQMQSRRLVFIRVHLFRRDEKARLAALDTGLSANAFIPISILDPGSDGLPGTFDDQRLTVYQQNPATLGQDHYMLTNPAGLRTLNVGFSADVRFQLGALTAGASFTAEKAWGPTNPGNAAFENDPGVLGALFADPNSSVRTLARSYVDRAYLGKLQASYRLPARWGGLDLASVVSYSDGLPFARQLLVSGLPQGPFLTTTTVRGSPEGGNRAQYLLNWNLRLQKEFKVQRGEFRATIDLLNVTNSSQDFQQVEFTGPSFNERLPVAVQPARFTRFGLEYSF